MRVGFLVLDGVYNSELAAPFDIFHHTIFHTEPAMTLVTVGRTRDPVTSFEGLRIAVDHDLESAPPLDVLVVPSAEHNMDSDLEDERLIAWVRTRGAAAKYVVSICDGAFVLAEAGLLDGRFCTTFPGDIDAFRARYPGLRVVEGVDCVRDGPAVTGVGGARSYEPALELVEHVYGTKVARGVARGMAMRWDVEQLRRFVAPVSDTAARSYLPGDRVDGDVTVETADGNRRTLASIVAAHPETRAVVLTVLAGAEAKPVAGRGGIWCEDTFSELANLRHLGLRYEEQDVLFVAVACPPIHHEAMFGYDAGSFVDAAVGASTYTRNRNRFVAATERLVAADALPFHEVAYDPRFRLLGPPRDAGAPAWQGRFKWFADTQTYGTPTIWVLTADLEVRGPPFFMNVYESEGRKLRFTPEDVARMIDVCMD
jgi:putative intracellular protease/amidase